MIGENEDFIPNSELIKRQQSKDKINRICSIADKIHRAKNKNERDSIFKSVTKEEANIIKGVLKDYETYKENR